jgi:hypothetical protein
MAPRSLLEALADVPDPRSRHGRRHPLLAILSLTVLAMLRGCKGPTAIAEFGRHHGVALAHALGFRRGKTPAPSCLSDLYRVLDAAAFEAVLSCWVAARLPPPSAGSILTRKRRLPFSISRRLNNRMALLSLAGER